MYGMARGNPEVMSLNIYGLVHAFFGFLGEPSCSSSVRGSATCWDSWGAIAVKIRSRPSSPGLRHRDMHRPQSNGQQTRSRP